MIVVCQPVDKLDRMKMSAEGHKGWLRTQRMVKDTTYGTNMAHHGDFSFRGTFSTLESFGFMLGPFWGYVGVILRSLWGHFGIILWYWVVLGPQEVSKRPWGREIQIFRTPSPAKQSPKLGPFSGYDV